MNRLGKTLRDESMVSGQSDCETHGEISCMVSWVGCWGYFFNLFCFTSRNEVSSVQGKIKAFTQICRCSYQFGIHVLLVVL